MKKIAKPIIIVIWALLFCLTAIDPAAAARGVPGSPEFGVGATLRLNGADLSDGLKLAGNLKLDWISIPISWSELQPKAGKAPVWSKLDSAITLASQNGLAVMISISRAPDWASTSKGPDATKTADLAVALTQRYAGSLHAIELFPGANLKNSWGANPSPKHYLRLFETVQKQLATAGSSVLLVAGGLTPLAPDSTSGMNDLKFLQGLYDAGARSSVSVISLRLSNTTGEPLKPSSGDPRTLRHYEDIRAVMLDNGHTSGLLWITRLNAPNGKINEDDKKFSETDAQADWLARALLQARSQLYIGVVFIQNLNPTADASTSDSMLLAGQKTHPFVDLLRAMSLNPSNASNGSLAQTNRKP